MSCAACGTENPAGARFCMSCGAQLRAPLPHLRHARAARGALLHELRAPDGRGSSAPAPAPAPDHLPEERRQVTVLFADLSGYTAVAERMDPEAVKSLVDRVLMRLGAGGRALRRHRRQVHRRQRDGDLRRAGRPRGRRGARGPRRARHAGGDGRGQRGPARRRPLRPARRRQHRRGARRRRRPGLHGHRRHRERRGAAAERGPARQRDRRRAHDARVERRGPLRAARAARAQGQVGAGARLGGRRRARRSRRSAAAPPSARRRWWAAPRSCRRWRRSSSASQRERAPHLVTLVGEAGVGKSRVLRELETQLCSRSVTPTFRTGRCLPYGSGIVFWALGEVLREECGIVDWTPPRRPGASCATTPSTCSEARTRSWARRPSARRR